MKKRKSPKTVAKARHARTRQLTKAEPARSPVEKAWGKLKQKFETFKRIPNRNDDAWEAALTNANRAAEAVLAKPAECLGDIELRIAAWGFLEATESWKEFDDLAHWKPNELATNSEFIASLRDDIHRIRRRVRAAMVAVGSIAAPSPDLRDKVMQS